MVSQPLPPLYLHRWRSSMAGRAQRPLPSPGAGPCSLMAASLVPAGRHVPLRRLPLLLGRAFCSPRALAFAVAIAPSSSLLSVRVELQSRIQPHVNASLFQLTVRRRHHFLSRARSRCRRASRVLVFVVELRLVRCRSSPRRVCSSSPKFGPMSSTRFGGARRVLHKYFRLAARTSPMSWSSMPRNHPRVVVFTNTVSHYHPIFTVRSVIVVMS